MALLITSQRFFQVWGYTVSHSELLLRSVKSDEFSTRIDVFFKGVKELHLPASFNGLSLETYEEGLQYPSILQGTASLAHGRKVYVAKGNGFVGYIVALQAWIHEDQGEYYDPSFFPTSIRHGVAPTPLTSNLIPE